MSHGICLQTFTLLTLSLLSLTGTLSIFAIAERTQAKVPSSDSCSRKSPCSCYLEHRGIIDLSAVPIPNTAFKNQTNDLFCEWNPCQFFTVSQTCVHTNLCKQDLNNKTYTNLGSEAEFIYNATDDTVVMLYQVGEMHTEIALKCSETTWFEIIQAYNRTHLYLALFSRCACPGRCVKGLSPGSSLCISFVMLVTTYFAVGALYRKTVYQAEGWDMIPHREFWRELPSLIRDGYMFFISPCLGNRVQYTMYQHVPGQNFEEVEETGEDEEDSEQEQR